jgi:ribosomal protein L37AE/L43A
VSILFGLLALNAFGQLAPDIAKGTPFEEVVRTYGWPKGKSVSGGRESWLYDRFQVLFQNGKVVSVSYIATDGSEPFKLDAPKAGPPDPGALNPPHKTAAKSVPAASAPAPRPSRDPAPSDFLVKQPTDKPSGLPTPNGFATGSVVVAISATAVLMGLLVLAINKREAAKRLSDELLEQKRREPFQPRKSWQEDVAENLRRANESKSSATPMSGEPVDTSRMAQDHAPAAPVIGPELTLELLRNLEWKRFEQIVALYYGETGVCAKCTCNGPDGGVDVRLHRNGEERPYCYIQCKAWGSEKVKLTTMREFLGVMAADKITEGIFLTTSDYWPEARTFAEANGIAALTADDFIRSFGALPAATRSRIVEEITSGDYTTPSCPSCSRKMVWKRSASFWACSKFPQCRSKPIYARNGQRHEAE